MWSHHPWRYSKPNWPCLQCVYPPTGNTCSVTLHESWEEEQSHLPEKEGKNLLGPSLLELDILERKFSLSQ